MSSQAAVLPTSCLADGLTDPLSVFRSFQTRKGKLHESFSNLKTESNRLLTMWMNGKKIAVEEIDVREENPPATDDEEEDEEAANKRQKT